MIHLMTDDGIACGKQSAYVKMFEQQDQFIEMSNDNTYNGYLCKKCLTKIKISQNELTNNAPSEACTNTDVMQRSELLVCPNCKSDEIVEFLNRNKRQCQICEHLWQTNSA